MTELCPCYPAGGELACPVHGPLAPHLPAVRSSWHMRPRAMARIRTVRRNSYVTAEVLEAQAQVALLHTRYRGTFPKGTLVQVDLTFRCVRHPWRGDLDNLEKLVLDALRAHRLGKLRDGTVLEGAGVYDDDRQVRRKFSEIVEVGDPSQEGVDLVILQLPQPN